MASRAERLISLHNSVPHKVQKEEWQGDQQAFDELKADIDSELRRLRSEAYQVATWFAAFQAVIFAAVAQAGLLNCHLWWCPVSLSVAVSVAAFLAIADKLYSMGEVREDIKEKDRDIAALQESLDSMELDGASLNLDDAEPRLETPRDKLAGYRSIVSKEGMFALLFLIGLCTFIALFSVNTLCRRCLPCSS